MQRFLSVLVFTIQPDVTTDYSRGNPQQTDTERKLRTLKGVTRLRGEMQRYSHRHPAGGFVRTALPAAGSGGGSGGRLLGNSAPQR